MPAGVPFSAQKRVRRRGSTTVNRLDHNDRLVAAARRRSQATASGRGPGMEAASISKLAAPQQATVRRSAVIAVANATAVLGRAYDTGSLKPVSALARDKRTGCR